MLHPYSFIKEQNSQLLDFPKWGNERFTIVTWCGCRYKSYVLRLFNIPTHSKFTMTSWVVLSFSNPDWEQKVLALVQVFVKSSKENAPQKPKPELELVAAAHWILLLAPGTWACSQNWNLFNWARENVVFFSCQPVCWEAWDPKNRRVPSDSKARNNRYLRAIVHKELLAKDWKSTQLAWGFVHWLLQPL